MVRLDRRLASIVAITCAALGPRTSAQSAPGTVLDEMLITEGVGGFTGELTVDDEFGSAVASIGDLDGDGRDELAVGALLDGAVWILYFDDSGKVRNQVELEPGIPWLGSSLASVGDLDGDGVQELAVGTWGDDGPGSVWILFLDHDASVKSSFKIGAGAGGFVGPLPVGAMFGKSVAAIGDLDGNGVTELAVGSPGDPDGSGAHREDVGALWILFLAQDGSVAAEQRISALHGGFPGTLGPGPSWFGSSVARVGDLDQDGQVELAVGASAPSGFGVPWTVWIVSIRSDGTAAAATHIDSSDPVFDGAVPDDGGFGWAAAGPGDLDGDGVPDLLLGEPFLPSGGSVWALFLQRDATAEHALRIGNFAGGFPNQLEPNDCFGWGLGTMRVGGQDGVLTVVAGAIGEGDYVEPEIGIDYDFSGGVWLLSLDAGASTGTWNWLPGALAGSNGLPQLIGEGPLIPSIDVGLHLSKAKPSSPVLLVVGFGQENAPLLGGTLVPTPDVLLPFHTNSNGKLNLFGDWPAGVPSGQPTYFQLWIEDAAGPQGYSASNGLAAVAP